MRRKTGKRRVAIMAVLGGLSLCALTACEREAPAPKPAPRASAEAARPPAGPERLVLAFGDSLYAGYNLSRGEAYPAQLERALWKRGINAKVINAGVSGDTTAAGRQRLGFALDNLPRTPDLAIVGLGGNDMLRGLAPEQARANLDAILSELRDREIPVVLTGMLAAPNLGEDYGRAFNAIYPDLARKHGAVLVPFFLKAVIGDPRLQQADGIHPTAQGVEAIVAETVDEVAAALPSSPPVQPSPR